MGIDTDKIITSKIDNKTMLKWKLWSQTIGFVPYKGKYSILLEKCDIFDHNELSPISTKKEYDLFTCFIQTIRSVYDENYTKDLVLQSIDSKSAVLIKILSMDSYISSGYTNADGFCDSQELKLSIKSLFREYLDCETLQTSENSRWIFCTDTELNSIYNILKSGSIDLPNELRIFKEEFTWSYLHYNNL